MIRVHGTRIFRRKIIVKQGHTITAVDPEEWERNECIA